MWKQRLAVAILAAALFARGLGFEFVWDDHDLIETNPAVTTEGAAGRWQELLASGFAASPFAPESGPYYRPLTIWTFALNHAVGGPDPRGFHAVNLLLHVAVTLVVLELLCTLGFGALPRLAGAALFAVHPVHVEPVLWVSGRTDLLAALFVLISYYACQRVLEGDPRDHGPRIRAFFSVALISYALALLAKEAALALPFILLANEATLWIGRRTGGRVRGAGAMRHRRGIMVLAGIAVISIAYVALRTQAMQWPGNDGPALSAPPWSKRIWSAPFVAARAAGLLLWPSSLTPVHDAAPVHSPLDPRFWLSVMTLAGAVVWIARGPETRRRFLQPVLFFLVAMFPVMGFVPLTVPFAERFLYLPSVALSWLAAECIARAGGATAARTAAVAAGHAGRRHLVIALCTFLIAAAAVRTWFQVPVWQDDVSLFSEIVARHPDSVPALSELAIASAKRGELERARDLLERATRLAPDFAPAHYNLGRVLEQLGDPGEAARVYARTLEIAPQAPGLPRKLLALLSAAGREEDARALLEHAAARGSAEAGSLLATMDDTTDAAP